MGSTKNCLYSGGFRSNRSDGILERKWPIFGVSIRTCCGHKWLCRRSRKVRRNDPRCPIDNEPLIETEQAAGGQPSEVRLSSEELQQLPRPTSREQTERLSFPIQEQHPHLHSGHLCGISRPFETQAAARPRPRNEEYQLLYNTEDGYQASGWSDPSTLGTRGDGQRTNAPGLFLADQQAEGGRDWYSSRSNVPTVEEEQDTTQRSPRNGAQNGAIPAKQKELVTEYRCGTREMQFWDENQRRLRLFEEAMMGRICKGTFHWNIRNFQQCRQDAITGAVVAQRSPAIYTELYGYTLCMRIYLNGVRSGIGTHVSLFVHMMQGECDQRLKWPFTGVITLSILDQSGAEVPEDITQVMVASPKLDAFKKPDAPCSPVGCGYEMFAPIAQICAGPFILNDTMRVKIEISR